MAVLSVIIFVMNDRASLFTDQRMPGLPIRAKYKHVRTICEHTSDTSPTVSTLERFLHRAQGTRETEKKCETEKKSNTEKRSNTEKQSNTSVAIFSQGATVFLT